jgi:Fe-S-cluster containining protein
MDFKCTGCGACCRVIGRAIAEADKQPDPFIRNLLKKFPHRAKPDGSCSKLGEDGKCTIYDKRPLLCNVEKLWKRHHKNKESKAEFFARSARACNQLIVSQNLDRKFFMNPLDYRK